MNLVLFSQDLILLARLTGAARSMAGEVKLVGSVKEVIPVCQNLEAQLLVVDLRVPDLDIHELVTEVRDQLSPQTSILACGPHVQEARLAAARLAGCDEVVTRGQFEREAEDLLAALLPRTA
jgi:CheY-like chemotaxis protein